MRWNLAFWLTLLTGWTALLSPLTSAQTHTAPLTVGVVPQFDARRTQTTWQPILDELTQRTGIRLTLSGSPSIPEFEKRMQQGEFDLVYLNPYHQVIANQKQGYIPILKDSSKQLFGILVVPKNSPIQRVEELAGKTVAFPAPNALGASLMMRADFHNKFHVDITPLYVKTHTSVYLNTALGKTSAGGGVMRTFNEQPPEVRDQLRVLYETVRVPPHPISVHPRVPAETSARLKAAFLALGETEAGRELLAHIPITRIGSASQADYLPLAEMGLDAVYEE
ncbi:phosphate/phosphite/phosphonate ABC transporter substrate-binding protein [Marinobacterium rhizophilum]|uniref:phosphate/phosphite/phosphonate ABC transporter substrate-binding protein n=1 Tax=Marinobacterium rhizophilum TaxID=420402 RepID=UPI000368E7BF|nr:phosphate/phosphite/phosphonate ABC transporter substrate-binding protein [Marinobacterium rhizophilum]